MIFRLIDLPYDEGALAPLMSVETLRTHHGKHHAKYVEVLNKLLAERGGGHGPLEDVVAEAGREGGKLYNNAGQAWNHGFFWFSMTPERSEPSGALGDAVGRDFGGLDGLKRRFVQEGADHFASGWTWLVARDGRLEVTSTHDAGSFDRLDGATPLAVCDVWEHAYYLDHKQDRKGFLEGWFDRLLDWRFAGEQFGAAAAGRPGWRYPAPV
ncbi:MAG TPA: superoxide dismutase [Caulobacteraceae bacterium]